MNSTTITRITVLVNGVAQATSASTLAQWLEEQVPQPGFVATALNGQFVPRSQRAAQTLAEGDAIVTFQPIEGG